MANVYRRLACGCFMIYTVFLAQIYPLADLSVVFVEHGTRQDHPFGVTTSPNGGWVAQ